MTDGRWAEVVNKQCLDGGKLRWVSCDWHTLAVFGYCYYCYCRWPYLSTFDDGQCVTIAGLGCRWSGRCGYRKDIDNTPSRKWRQMGFLRSLGPRACAFEDFKLGFNLSIILCLFRESFLKTGPKAVQLVPKNLKKTHLISQYPT